MARDSRHSTAIQRFMRRVSVGHPGGCWIWTGGRSQSRGGAWYGLFSVGFARPGAHRWAYEHFIGPLRGLEPDHLCRTTLCVNPDHLEAVTHSENIRRGYRARMAA